MVFSFEQCTLVRAHVHKHTARYDSITRKAARGRLCPADRNEHTIIVSIRGIATTRAHGQSNNTAARIDK